MSNKKSIGTAAKSIFSSVAVRVLLILFAAGTLAFSAFARYKLFVGGTSSQGKEDA